MFWPATLATRTLLTLLVGLALVQGAGLTIHALDRIELQHQAELRNIGFSAMNIYRTAVATSPAARPAALRELAHDQGVQASLSSQPPNAPAALTAQSLRRVIRVNMNLVPLRPANRPAEVVMRGMPWDGQVVIGYRFPDGGWLNVTIPVPPPRPWHSPTFLLAFVLMTMAAAALSFWAVRRLVGPVGTLAEAAERLGRDVNAPPLPEDGPAEVARAAVAFNTMAKRISRFVSDRTFLLTAMGHDLRTPITRLRLRAEFIDDDELRAKFLTDLAELDGMVAATLAFGRDTADTEAAVALDLAALLRTVLDEAADAWPRMAEGAALCGAGAFDAARASDHAKTGLRQSGGNAVTYGGAARVRLVPAAEGMITITIEDDGPGVPADQLERVFDPFYRVERQPKSRDGRDGAGVADRAQCVSRAWGGCGAGQWCGGWRSGCGELAGVSKEVLLF